MTARQRLWLFGAGIAGLAAFYLWGLHGLPGFGHYPGPYGDIISKIAVGQTKATGVVSAVNFSYRAIDTLGEEFILFAAATGVSTVLRHLRNEREDAEGDGGLRPLPPATSDAVRQSALVFVGPVVVFGWFLTTHAQTSPSGGFQGGVVLATAFVLIYLSGGLLVFRRISPADVTDAVEAVAAGGFAIVGLAAVLMSLPYLANYLPLGTVPGAVSSSGTIALISLLVGIEVGAAFIVIIAEFLEQTLLVRERASR